MDLRSDEKTAVFDGSGDIVLNMFWLEGGPTDVKFFGEKGMWHAEE